MINKSILVISTIGVSVLLLISIVFAVTVYLATTSSTGLVVWLPRVVNHVMKESWGMLE
jgi:hypothetical protein